MTEDRAQELWRQDDEAMESRERAGLFGTVDELDDWTPEQIAHLERDVLGAMENLKPGQLSGSFGIGRCGRREEALELGKD